MSPAVLRVVDALRVCGCDPHPEGDGWRARCPVHDGTSKRSLKVDEGDDGKAVLCCYNGCSHKAIVERIGLTEPDLFSDETSARERTARPKTAPERKHVDAPWTRLPDGSVEIGRYPYTLDDGAGHALKVRYQRPGAPEKTFLVYEVDPTGGFWSRLGGRKLDLYVPAPIADRSSMIGLLSEGEKATDRLVRYLDEHPDEKSIFVPVGSHGDGSFHGEDGARLVAQLAGFTEIIAVVDRDDAGSRWAEDFRRHAEARIPRIRFVQSAVETEKADLFDHLEADHALTALVPFAKPGENTDARINPAVSLATVTPLHVEYVVRDLFRLVGVALLYGAASVYKTLLMLRLVTELMQARGHASGAPKLYGHPEATILRPWRRVVWVSAEETAGALRARWDLVLAALGIKAEDVSGEILFVWPFSKDGVVTLHRAEELLDSVGGDVDAMIFDSWTSLVPAMFEGRAVEWDRDNIATRHLINILRDVAERRRIAIQIVHHEGKDAGRGLRGPSELRNSADTVIRLERLPERRVKVKIEKQRDGRDEWDFTLAVDFSGDAFHVRPEERKRPTLTQPQQTVLAFLTGRGSASVAEIVKGTELTRSSVKRALEGLAKDGSVVSTEDTDGNGSIVWSVSEGVREVSGNA